MGKLKLILMLSISFLFSACGGGGGSGSVSPQTQDGADLEAKSEAGLLDGIYIGDALEMPNNEFVIMAFVMDNEIHAFANNGTQYEGEIIPIIDDVYNLSLIMYDGSNLSAFDQAIVEGTYEPGKFIDGEYDRRFGASGEFKLEYAQSMSEKRASLDLVNGIWSTDNLSSMASVTIEENGDLFGTDSDGCTYTGKLQAPRSDRNLYKVNVSVENCSQYTGSYSGLASQITYDSKETLAVFMANSSYAYSLNFVKQ